MAETNNEYTLVCTLPSRGLIYDTPVNPEIKLRSITGKDEKIRLNFNQDLPTDAERNAASEEALAKTIEACIVKDDEYQGLGIPVYDLCYGDFKFLENRLRIVSLDSDYDMVWRCPYCGEISTYTVNLYDSKVKELESFDETQDLTVKLPRRGDIITLRYETPRISKKVIDEVVRLRNADTSNAFPERYWFLTERLVYATKYINGETKPVMADLVDYYDHLTKKDLQAVVNALNNFNQKVGLDGVFDVHCNQCGNNIKIPFRYSSEFWEPSYQSER